MGVTVAVKGAATKVGAIVSEHGDTITKVKDTSGRVVQVSELSRQAANSSTFRESLNTGLDALSLVVAGVGTVPGVNLGTVPAQALIGAAKTVNNALHGDMKAAKLSAIEGVVTTGASMAPGGGLAVKVGKGALVVGGEVAKHVVSSSANDEQFNTAAMAPAKTPGMTDASKSRGTT